MLEDAIRNFAMVEAVFWENLIVACHGHFLQANFGNDVRIDVFAEVTLVNSRLKIFSYKFRKETVLEFLDDLPCFGMVLLQLKDKGGCSVIKTCMDVLMYFDHHVHRIRGLFS